MVRAVEVLQAPWRSEYFPVDLIYDVVNILYRKKTGPWSSTDRPGCAASHYTERPLPGPRHLDRPAARSEALEARGNQGGAEGVAHRHGATEARRGSGGGELNPYSGFFGFLYNWQSIEAGILALAAGYFAFAVGRQQVNALREQNLFLKTESKRNLARLNLTACTLILGVISLSEENIKSVMVRLAGSTSSGPNAIFPGEALRGVKIPEINVVWSELAKLSSDSVEQYLSLDTEISKLSLTGHYQIHDLTNILQKIIIIINALKTELIGNRTTSLKLLSENIIRK